jgi:SWIM zinc finger
MAKMIVLATVASKSNANRTYEIRLGKDEKVYCTCPAWKFSGTGNCKHLREFRNQ